MLGESASSSNAEPTMTTFPFRSAIYRTGIENIPHVPITLAGAGGTMGLRCGSMATSHRSSAFPGLVIPRGNGHENDSTLPSFSGPPTTGAISAPDSSSRQDRLITREVAVLSAWQSISPAQTAKTPICASV